MVGYVASEESEGYDQSHYAGKSSHRHENNTGFCFCQFIQKNGDFPAISVKERNRAAPPPIFKSGSLHIAGIGFCHFSSQCERVFK